MTTIIISGVTCAGKSKLLDCLLKAGVDRVVTVTTRTIRPGEINGLDYQFATADEFAEMEKQGLFLETNRFGSASYGTLRQSIERDGLKAIVVDPNGHRAIKAALKKKGKPYLSVFLDADEGLQAGRFMARCRQDAASSFGTGRTPEASIKRSTARLAAMLGVEAHWRDVARCAETPYDLVVPSYDRQTELAVISEILERAKEAMKGS